MTETHIYCSIRIRNGMKLASAYSGLGKQDEINMGNNVHYNKQKKQAAGYNC